MSATRKTSPTVRKRPAARKRTTRKTSPTVRKRPAARKRTAVCRPIVAEYELDRLVEMLRAVCRKRDGERTVLQLDFMRGETGPKCVLRIAEGPRTWLKMGEGPWHDGYLQALIDRGLVAVVERFRLGATLAPLPGLLEQQREAA